MVTLAEIDLPMIFKNKLLFSPGVRNNLNILSSEISKSLDLTNWADQRTRSIYFAHSARDAQKWVGRINNPHVINGELFGDLEIHDADLAMKLGPGKAPIGVSAEIKWPPQYNDPTDFMYRSFAMVPNPEVIETMINFSKQNDDDGYKVATLYTSFVDKKEDFAEETEAEYTKGETSDFEDHKHQYSINDLGNGHTISGNSIGPEKKPVSHTHGIVGFQVQVADNHTHSIPKISNNSKINKEDREVTGSRAEASADFSDGVITSQTTRGTPIVEEIKEESNLMSAERGFNEKKMENKNAKNEVAPEVKEEEVVETVEETTEEAKVEEEAVKAEDSKEADFSAMNDKLEALSTRIVALEENQAKFSEEAKVEEAPAKEASEESTEEETEEEAKEEVKEEEEEVEDAKADFSEVVAKIDKLADAMIKKEAAPMSTAEFGAHGVDKGNAVIDRLTKELSN